MEQFGFLATRIMVHLPMVVVTLGGIALIATRSQVLRRSAGLAITGCSLLFASAIATLAWTMGLPELFRRGYTPVDVGVLAFAAGAVLSLLSAAGVAFLIAAVLTGTRQPATPADDLRG